MRVSRLHGQIEGEAILYIPLESLSLIIKMEEHECR
jgi:hypothetical protein